MRLDNRRSADVYGRWPVPSPGSAPEIQVLKRNEVVRGCSGRSTHGESSSNDLRRVGSEVQAFSPNRSDQPLTKCIHFGCSNRSFQNADTEPSQFRVYAGGEDRVAVVDDITVGMIERQKFAELLCGPLRGRSPVTLQ